MYISIVILAIIKSFFTYVLVLMLSKLIGTKIISQMNFFDFIMGISLGSMISAIIIDKDNVIISGVTAIVTFASLTIGTSHITLKSYKFRNIINAKTLVLVENGRIIDKNIKKIRITINELMMKLREKDIFNLEDVQYAVMESSGEISVLVKSDKKPVTPCDMKLKVKISSLINDIIIDGKVIEKNLKIVDIDEAWLKSELKKKNINNIEDVFYAGIDQNKKLIVSEKYPKNFNPEGKFGIE